MSMRMLIFTVLLALGVLPTCGEAEENAFTLEAETGALWFSRNRTQIPADTGTRFDLDDLTGSGADPYLRLSASYRFNPKHSVRLTYAPIRASGNAVLLQDLRFRDADFSAGQAARGVYRFDTYRLTYRWTFHNSERFDLGVGGAVLLRDARIELQQGNTRRSDDDIGVVPLLHVYAARHLSENTSLVLDIEGAAAPQGRAVDAALTLRHTLPSGWQVFGGYRTLEGGADNDDVYTFAWMHFATLGFAFSF